MNLSYIGNFNCNPIAATEMLLHRVTTQVVVAMLWPVAPLYFAAIRAVSATLYLMLELERIYFCFAYK